MPRTDHVCCCMPTPAERQALLFLAALAVLGGGVRAIGARRFLAQTDAAEQLVAGRPSATLGARALAAQIAAVDSAQQTARTRRSNSRAPRRTSAAPRTLPELREERVPRVDTPVVVNLNQSSARELERLPRVGPALAARIISWRETHGPFRSLEDLRHVRGIGPVTAALLAPSVTF